ncbi:hypothetical protein TorRG33x02_273370 [Trema orientale]|uniref:Uncharacterized protein n=1 Tax=Trema orientale TaxID=63057 RepID=A0A2P5CTD5_TREOI|nr:hypothetical protein TorRG33x02_273370 [Trema orientale]
MESLYKMSYDHHEDVSKKVRLPPKRGKIKAKIFEELVETVINTVTRSSSATSSDDYDRDYQSTNYTNGTHQRLVVHGGKSSSVTVTTPTAPAYRSNYFQNDKKSMLKGN